MTDDALKLLLLEDDPKLGPIMRDILALDWEVTLATDLAAARACAEADIFDVAVVDRRLPDGDGTEFITWLRGRGSGMPILMLTALGEIGDKVSGLDAGANDYLVKPFDFQELGARLRALTRDYSRRGEGVEIGGWTYFAHNGTIESPYTGRVVLTEKEAALLGELVKQPDTAFTRQQLLTAVFDRGEQEGTVDTYVHYIRRKTERSLIETVRGVGYRLGTPA
ncbi:two-component system response regulator QseB [Leucobacter exalbidus]|uniref:Two-component system response regulator QseB n=1 Tax=Leucobacter exalbidus TaxID=662960 RepID=A0A940T477_9MICO|nr:response regulator transcription factor [Leucobacter exalbidus]MBP1326598.1 two-component system response regulator QseB [Leucobacter exalbidus]